MARADRRRAVRTRAPAVAARGGTTIIEDQLFFSRLRRQAKWIFVVLAVIFGGSFVVFGVGSEVPGGIADVFQGSGAQSEVSVDDARKKVEENPKDATALRELATALQAEGRADEAIDPLRQYIKLKPNDTRARSDLASLYVSKATRLRNEAARAQAESQIVVPAHNFAPPSTTPLGSALANEPIRQEIERRTNEKLGAVYEDMQTAFEQAQRAYAAIARRTPNDPSIQLQLANAAVNAGDTEVALKAYRRFLRLAPDDTNAPVVRDTIKQLEQQQQQTP
jgi:Flp pilus assembly protein TadD